VIEVIVARKHRETEDICLLELARPDGAPLPAFSAGAHIDLHLPGGLIRQYSLCNHPGEMHRYEIAVLRDPNSRGGSLAVHDQVSEGDKLSIGEPRNLFPLDHGARRHLLIAGGIGVTPILCMAERLSHQGADFEMHYCTKTPEQTAFRERIGNSPFADRVSFHYSRIAPATRLDADALLSDPQPDTHLYVCGPNPFKDHILDTARGCGWDEALLHREYFAADEVDHEGDRAFEVMLAGSGEVIEIPADRSVLEVLLEREIDIPYACENGVCGTCVTRVLEGEPDHRDMFLTPDEKATNEEFAPCCSRAKSARLILDI